MDVSCHNNSVVMQSAPTLSNTSYSGSSLNLCEVPITALRHKTKSTISMLLNPTKVLPSEEGVPRDWRGLAHFAGIQGEHLPSFSSLPDPTSKILMNWGQNARVQDLQDILGRIDRWDIVDDTRTMMEDDAHHYLTMTVHSPAITLHNLAPEDNMLTIDDIHRSQQGLNMQTYDAFVLFADADIDFATKLIEKMEGYGFKLCVKERDLLGGISFEHEAIMKLISERCNRLIVIISPAFLQSPANTFFVNFAQALGIDQRKRKIVPCLYERCQLPPTLSYYFLLKYEHSGNLYNFWEKLRESLQTYSVQPSPTHRTSSGVTIREIESAPSANSLSMQSSPQIQLPKLTLTSPNNQIQNISQIQAPQSAHETNGSDVRMNMESAVLSDVNEIGKMKTKQKWYTKFIPSNSSNKTDEKPVKEKQKWLKRKKKPLHS